MTREEFETNALLRLRDLYPEGRFLRAGQLEIAVLRTPSGRPTAHRLRLARAWAAFCQNGPRFDLDTYLTRVVGTIERCAPADWESARPLIYPKLTTARMLRRSTRPLFYPIAGELGYALSCEQYDVLLAPEHLANWSIPEECVLAAAMENLRRLWDQATVVAWTVDESIRAFHLEVEHHHKAAFVLLPEFYDRGVELLDAESLTVAVPNRNFVLAFCSGDKEFRHLIEPVLRKEFAEGYPLSRLLLGIRDSGYSVEQR